MGLEAQPSSGEALFEKGLASKKQNQVDESLRYFLQAAELFGTTQQQDKVVECYKNIGFLYIFKGESDLALSYFDKGLSLHEEAQDSLTLQLYQAKAIVYSQRREAATSFGYYSKALSLAEKLYLDVPHQYLAEAYNNLGTAYLQQDDVAGSRAYFDKGREVYAALYDTMGVALSYVNLGRTYDGREEGEKAVGYYRQAIQLLENNSDKYQKLLAFFYSYTAKEYQVLGRLRETLGYTQKAVSLLGGDAGVLCKGQLPDLQRVIYPKDLLDIVLLQADVYGSLWREEGKRSDLDCAYHSYQFALALIDAVRTGLAQSGSKLRLLKDSWSVYEGGIQVCLWLYEVSGEERYLSDAFGFSEKSKAMLLYEAVHESQAKVFAGIPEALQQEELEMKKSLTNYQVALQRLQQAVNVDKGEISKLMNQVFDLRARHQRFIRRMEEAYPAYYALKYDVSTVDVAGVQEMLSGSNQVLLEYFVGKDSLYMFLVEEDGLRVETIGRDSLMEEDIEGLRSLVQAKDFAHHSYALYQTLLAPFVEAIEGKDLIVIRDGALNHLAFDALLAALPEDIYSYEVLLPYYLIQSHEVSYDYSATMYSANLSKASNRGRNGVLMFAPGFDKALKARYREAMNGEELDEAYLNQLSQPFSLAFVEEIRGRLGGKYLMREDALEARFKSLANNYRILALVTHAEMNDQKPMYSRIVFAQGIGGEEDGYLHTYEIYNMEIAADLVVLTACQTGVGKLEKGEGAMSLARAFSYAGCPSIVMSLWPIDDQQTQVLMDKFYGYLEEGVGKSTALHRAKLDFLSEAVSDELTNPYYWAGLTFSGNPRPVDLSRNWFWVCYWVLGVLMIGILGVYLYRRFGKM